MAVVYFVEHGDTKYDAKGCAQGLLDDGLTEAGRRQARQAANCLISTSIDCVYTSPMKRARETAKILADKLGAEIVVLPHLKPLDIGSLAGKPESTVRGYLEFFAKRPTLAFPDGGKFGDYYDRVKKEWIHQFADDDPEIAVVSHSRDFQLLKHWQRNGLDAEPENIRFDEPPAGHVAKVTRSGNSIQVRAL